MGPPAWQPGAAVIPSLEPRRCPFLAGDMGWSSRLWLDSPRCTAPAPDWRQEVPHQMPWATQDPGVVSFTGAALPGAHQPPHAASLALKRRLEKEEQPPHPKQFLSEEKMAARFNSLSLDNDHVYSANGFPPRAQQLWGYARYQAQRLPPTGGDKDTGTAEGDVVLEGEFSMADYAHHGLPAPPWDALGSILPPHILQSLDPSTELVLWTPPGSRVPHSVRTLMLPPRSLAVPPLPPMGRGLGAPLEEMEL
ncbi:host cell factor C1 regulator 1 [Emydura macquarii macquarii]|uniref:host cell factor C1 regulator 1 n=1 Tax=Emydura macquarii macquarii TaxID=1129001 RepID=UPI00352BBF50